MIRAIYPGSFDPVTYGHLDIIERASKVPDELIVGVLCNKAKTPLFSVDERVKMLKRMTAHLENVRILPFEGLLVDFAEEMDASIIIRGLRAITDFEMELQMAQTNHIMHPKLDTIFFTTSLEYSYLCSSTVREVASFGGDISKFVPPEVEDAVKKKFADKGE